MRSKEVIAGIWVYAFDEFKVLQVWFLLALLVSFGVYDFLERQPRTSIMQLHFTFLKFFRPKTFSRLKEILIKSENFQSIKSFWFIQGPLMAALQANHPYANRARSIYLYCAACLTNTGE